MLVRNLLVTDLEFWEFLEFLECRERRDLRTRFRSTRFPWAARAFWWHLSHLCRHTSSVRYSSLRRSCLRFHTLNKHWCFFLLNFLFEDRYRMTITSWWNSPSSVHRLQNKFVHSSRSKMKSNESTSSAST